MITVGARVEKLTFDIEIGYIDGSTFPTVEKINENFG